LVDLFEYLLTVFDTLLLRALLHCNTPLHFTTLHPTTSWYMHWTYTISIRQSRYLPTNKLLNS